MSTELFRKYIDLLNEADSTGQPPAEFVPTHFHKTNLGTKIPLMQTPDGKFYWITSDPENPRAGRTIQPWIGNTENRSGFGSASVDGIFKDGNAIEFPEGTTWKDYANNQNAEIAPAATASADAAASVDSSDSSSNIRLTKKDGDAVIKGSGRPSIDFRTGAIKGDDTAGDTASDQDPFPPGGMVKDGHGNIIRGKPDAAAELPSGTQWVYRRKDDGAGASSAGDWRNLPGETHCAQCGTPKSMHQGLQHEFAAGDDVRPDPVSQSGDTGGNEKADRIRAMQADLKKAGADLGTFGPEGNGIDGVIGKVTQAAMAKYPDIAKKYPDLVGGGQNKQGKVNLDKLNTALSTIEGILNKYKVKINEDQEPQTSTDQMKNWRALMEAPPTLTPAQQAAQRAGLGIPRLAGAPAVGAAGSAAAAATGSTAMKAAGALGKGAARLSPGLGAALAIPDVYSRAKEGDYVGAGISTLAGLASFFPLAGTAAALGLTGLNYYLDSNKKPTVAISAEDAKIIGDNIKIIQDWQKDPANADGLTPELKTRIANDFKAVAAMGIPTQGAEPASAAGANGSAVTPPAAAADINTTLDSMDKFLTKHQFESIRKELLKNQHLLSETERIALHRDLLKEDWSDYLPSTSDALWGLGGYNAGKAVANRAAATPSAAAIPAAAPAPPSMMKSLLTKAWSAIKTVGRVAGRVGWWGVLIAGGVAAKSFWDWIRSDPHAASAAGLTTQEMAEWKQLDDQLNKLIPDRETFDALPYDVQKKAMAINERRIKFMAWVTEKAEQQAQQQPK